MSKGILLIAYGKTYGKYAYNLAASIKSTSDVKIHLACDYAAISDIPLDFFDSHLVYDFKKDNGKIDPCQAKIDIYEISPFKETLYLDVDGVCMNDIKPLFETLKGSPVYFQVMGKGKFDDTISYAHWADNNTVWEHFELTKESVFPSSQTSVIYFDKGKEANSFFKQLQKNYNNRLQKKQYKNMWGLSKSHPDELYYSVTAAQLNIIPDESIQPLFYPNKLENEGKIMKDYIVLSVYGGHRTIKDYSLSLYDRIMKGIMKLHGLSHIYKAHDLYKLKFVMQK